MSDCDDILTRVLLDTPLDDTAAEHLAGCSRCREDEPVARRLAGAIAGYAVPPSTPQLTARVLAATAPLLTRRAHPVRTTDWRAVARAVGAALLPLPALVLIQVWVLRGLHQLLTTVLPAPLGTALVVNYVVLLALLATLTYAAVPLVAARQAEARHV